MLVGLREVLIEDSFPVLAMHLFPEAASQDKDQG